MKFSIIKNLKTAFNKSILPRLKNAIKSEPLFLRDVNLSIISLERTPFIEEFQKQTYSQFLSGIENDSHKTTIATILLRANPMNKETYSKLSSEKLETIRAQLTPALIEDAKLLVSIAKITKKFFDEKYGENQYTFISIGRSLSALTNCLDFIGVNTRQIPLSGCGGYETNVNKTVDTIVNQEGFKQYKEFLNKTLETNKKRLFCDFSVTGKTLRVFKSLLNHPKLKLGKKNDEYISINGFLINNLNNDILKYKYWDPIMKFDRMLYKQRFDDYAEVRPLGFRNLKKLYSALNPDPKESMPNKLMNFCMLDMLKFENTQKS